MSIFSSCKSLAICIGPCPSMQSRKMRLITGAAASSTIHFVLSFGSLRYPNGTLVVSGTPRSPFAFCTARILRLVSFAKNSLNQFLIPATSLSVLLGSMVSKWSLMAIYRTPYFGKVKLIYSPVSDEFLPSLDRSLVQQTATFPASISASIAWKPGRS